MEPPAVSAAGEASGEPTGEATGDPIGEAIGDGNETGEPVAPVVVASETLVGIGAGVFVGSSGSESLPQALSVIPRSRKAATIE